MLIVHEIKDMCTRIDPQLSAGAVLFRTSACIRDTVTQIIGLAVCRKGEFAI